MHNIQRKRHIFLAILTISNVICTAEDPASIGPKAPEISSEAAAAEPLTEAVLPPTVTADGSTTESVTLPDPATLAPSPDAETAVANGTTAEPEAASAAAPLFPSEASETDSPSRAGSKARLKERSYAQATLSPYIEEGRVPKILFDRPSGGRGVPLVQSAIEIANTLEVPLEQYISVIKAGILSGTSLVQVRKSDGVANSIHPSHYKYPRQVDTDLYHVFQQERQQTGPAGEVVSVDYLFLAAIGGNSSSIGIACLKKDEVFKFAGSDYYHLPYYFALLGYYNQDPGSSSTISDLDAILSNPKTKIIESNGRLMIRDPKGTVHSVSVNDLFTNRDWSTSSAITALFEDKDTPKITVRDGMIWVNDMLVIDHLPYKNLKVATVESLTTIGLTEYEILGSAINRALTKDPTPTIVFDAAKKVYNIWPSTLAYPEDADSSYLSFFLQPGANQTESHGQVNHGIQFAGFAAQTSAALADLKIKELKRSASGASLAESIPDTTPKSYKLHS